MEGPSKKTGYETPKQPANLRALLHCMLSADQCYSILLPACLRPTKGERASLGPPSTTARRRLRCSGWVAGSEQIHIDIVARTWVSRRPPVQCILHTNIHSFLTLKPFAFK